MRQSHPVSWARILAGGLLIGTMGAGIPTSAQSPGASPAASAPVASGPVCVDGAIGVGSSSDLGPALQQAADQYMTACPDSVIAIDMPGSGGAVSSLLAGDVAIAATVPTADTIFSSDEVAPLVDHPMVEVWAMVTSPDVTGVTGLTKKEARNVWSGKIDDWQKLGGPKLPITLIVRSESAAHAALEDAILGKGDQAEGQVVPDSDFRALEVLDGISGGIALVGLSALADAGPVNVLALADVVPSLAAAGDGTYPLAGTTGHLYTLGPAEGLAAAFIDHVLGVAPAAPAGSMTPLESPGASSAP